MGKPKPWRGASWSKYVNTERNLNETLETWEEKILERCPKQTKLANVSSNGHNADDLIALEHSSLTEICHSTRPLSLKSVSLHRIPPSSGPCHYMLDLNRREAETTPITYNEYRRFPAEMQSQPSKACKENETDICRLASLPNLEVYRVNTLGLQPEYAILPSPLELVNTPERLRPITVTKKEQLRQFTSTKSEQKFMPPRLG